MGLYKLLEGFVFILPLTKLVTVCQNRTSEAIAYLENWGIVFIDAATTEILLRMILDPLLAFLFIFVTFFGYSRVAEGVALLMGFEVPENFRQPFNSQNFSDFWQRWHRSMADFVMKYLYLPVSIHFKNPKLGLIGAFIFMGLWHKVSLGYLFWGIAHGSALIWLQPILISPNFSRLLARFMTLTFVIYVSYIANHLISL